MLSLVVVALLTGSGGGEPAAAAPHHPHDVIIDAALAPGFPRNPHVLTACPGTMNLLLVSTDECVSWRETRTGLSGKRFERIAFASDWETSGTAYVVTLDGGLQISTDFGKSWNAPTFKQQYLRFLEVPPVDDGRRCVVTATKTKLLVSTDGAATVTQLQLPLYDNRITALGVSPKFAEDGVMFVGTSDKRLLRRSNASGEWTVTKLPAAPTEIEASPDYASDRTIWVTTWEGGVLKSTDGGVSFEAINDGLGDLDVNDVAIARGANGLDVYVATREDGVYRALAGSTTWERTALRVKKTPQTDNHHARVVLSPTWPEDKTVLCCCYEGLYVSRDGGDAWQESNVHPTRVGRHIWTSPDFANDQTLLAAGYGMHLLVSEDAGENWDIRYADLRAKSVYSIGVSPNLAKDNLVILGVARGVRRSTDRGRTWNRINLPPHPDETDRAEAPYTVRSVTFSPNFAEDKIVYAQSDWGVPYISGDAGLTWMVAGRVPGWAKAFAVSPNFSEDKTVYSGTGKGVFRSTDAGATWTQLTDIAPVGDGMWLAPDFATSREIYVVDTFRGFVLSKDGGETWEPSNAGFGAFLPSVVRLSPAFVDDGTMYTLTNGGGVFRTTDRGRTWSRAGSLGGPVDHSFSLAVSSNYANDRTVIVGTYNGFERSTDGGETWTPITSFELYDDQRDPWARSGKGWRMDYTGKPFNTSVSVSETEGDTISIPFYGTGCRLLSRRAPNYGIGEVWLDGKLQSTVDLYAAEREEQHVVLDVGDLANGPHRLWMRVTGKKNEAASEAWVGVDAVEVTFR